MGKLTKIKKSITNHKLIYGSIILIIVILIVLLVVAKGTTKKMVWRTECGSEDDYLYQTQDAALCGSYGGWDLMNPEPDESIVDLDEAKKRCLKNKVCKGIGYDGVGWHLMGKKNETNNRTYAEVKPGCTVGSCMYIIDKK